MEDRSTVLLLRVVYFILFSIFIIFSVFYFFINPILSETNDLVVAYSCIATINLLFFINPRASLKAINREAITAKDVAIIRMAGMIFIILSMLKLLEYLQTIV